MARRPGYARSASARVLAAVLVGALVLVTAVLVFFAIDRATSPVPDGTPAPVPSFTFAPQSTTTPDSGSDSAPEPSASESPASMGDEPLAGADGAAAGARFLAVGSGGVLWRATAGECGGTTPLIERSADEGATWTDVTPLYRDIGEVAALEAFAGVQAELIAAMGDDCEPQALRTFTQGQFWEPYPEVLASSRYLDPSAATAVVTPDATVEAPCASPQSFRAQGDLVAVVCDGQAFRLAGSEWSPLAVTEVRALAVAGATVLTAAEASGCGGLAVTRWSGADLATATDLGCAEQAAPSAPVAVAGTASSAVLWSGDQLLPVG